MKGRQTSFQRFGSVLGATGSAVHKFTRSLGGEWPQDKGKGRDSDLARPASQADCSDGLGIYNNTIKSSDTLEIKTGDTDLGEEVYGCISHGFGNTNNIEKDAETAKFGREVKRTDSKHFDSHKRLWYNIHGSTLGGGAYGVLYEDSTLIPQENVPLVVNSKFEMKYWEDDGAGGGELIEIPKGAGFTSGALVRPVAFTDKANEPIKDGSMNSRYLRSHTLKAVPMKTAHAILNRCKEMSLTGSVNYSVERQNKECSGVKESKYEWTSEQNVGCPPGSCVDTGGTITLSCASTSQTTKITIAGDIDMTARRHKQVTDIWDEPKALDISGNYFSGSSSDKATYMKISESVCDAIIDSIPTPLPIPQVEQIALGEQQMKLNSGCLTYPITSSAMLHATLEENLKTKVIDVENCSYAATDYSLMDNYLQQTNFNYNYFYSAAYPGGVRQFDLFDSVMIRPEFASGPSLVALFNNNGWDFSGIGYGGPEDAYSRDCKGGEGTNFYNYKGKWNSTGITMTLAGSCPQGMSGLDRYDTSTVGCVCDDSCEDCKSNYGELRMRCDCLPMCTPYPNTANPCSKGASKAKCDAVYTVFMEIGKYVGVEILPEFQYYNTAAVPLSTAMDTKNKNEDLTLWWNAEIAQLDPDDAIGSTSRSLPFYLNEESANNVKPQDNSTTRWEAKEVGTLFIKCDDWSTETPLWGVYPITKETTCKGIKSGSNYYTTSEDAGIQYCGDCAGNPNGEDCCDPSGCAGKSGGPEACCNTVLCGISDPCNYSVTSVDSRPACNQPSCSGACTEIGPYCGCCNCGGDDEDGDCAPCPPATTCAPLNIKSNYEEMGCYGDAHEEDIVKASVNLTLEFKLFTEME